MQASFEWKWQYLSIRENDITDFAMDDICSIIDKLSNLERLEIQGNLLYRVRKFKELVARL